MSGRVPPERPLDARPSPHPAETLGATLSAVRLPAARHRPLPFRTRSTWAWRVPELASDPAPDLEPDQRHRRRQDRVHRSGASRGAADVRRQSWPSTPRAACAKCCARASSSGWSPKRGQPIYAVHGDDLLVNRRRDPWPSTTQLLAKRGKKSLPRTWERPRASSCSAVT